MLRLLPTRRCMYFSRHVRCGWLRHRVPRSAFEKLEIKQAGQHRLGNKHKRKSAEPLQQDHLQFLPSTTCYTMLHYIIVYYIIPYHYNIVDYIILYHSIVYYYNMVILCWALRPEKSVLVGDTVPSSVDGVRRLRSCMYVCVCIYIYIQRERDTHIYIHIYIYIHVY